jgi:hypothetical protein
MFYGFACGISTMDRLSTDFFGMEEAWYGRVKHFIMRFFGLIVSVVAIIITLIVLLHGNGQTTLCPSCTWLSCVTLPPWEDATHKWWYCDDCGRVTADIISQPALHLDLHCPSNGKTITVDLSKEPNVSHTELQMRLPSYCREYCLNKSKN